MPIYEFTCHKCEKDFELLCPMDTRIEQVKCPSCSQADLSRKVSVFGFVSGGEGDSCIGGTCGTSNSCGGGSCGMGGFESGGFGGCGPSGCGCDG